ncbi:ATP-binding protein [Bacillus sp. D386]|uniref:ATP-binding protein n=1 Tax=Bacillus sp. D386 TaxID=2587155 RepID=UPI00111E90E5|nr:ATP-binding protein [Bacillus sp. D386]
MVINSFSYEKAIYKEQEIPEFRGNPLIEALPNLMSTEKLIKFLYKTPHFSYMERDLESHYRIQCVMRLFELFIPNPLHIEIDQKINMAMRRGYVYRNIMEADYQNIHRYIKDKFSSNKDAVNYNKSLSFPIIGISGVGKTTSVERILSQFPRIIHHTEYNNFQFQLLQVPWLKIECPYNGSLKELCFSLFQTLDLLLDTNYVSEFGKSRYNIGQLLVYFCKLVMVHSIGVLIIDEIQYLVNGSKSKEVLNFLVSLINQIGIPIIFVGTNKSYDLLKKEARIARRISGLGAIEVQRMEKDEYIDFLKNIWRYQWVKNPTNLDRHTIEYYYEHTQGVADFTIKLFALSQIKSILFGEEQMNIDLYKTVFKNELAPLIPIIKALRTNDYDALAAFEDLLPLDVASVIVGIKNDANSIIHIKANKAIKEEAAIQELKNNKMLIIEHLMGVGLTALEAEKSVDSLLEEDINNPVVGLKKALGIYENRQSKMVKSKPREKSLLKCFNRASNDGDKIYYELLNDGYIDSFEWIYEIQSE